MLFAVATSNLLIEFEHAATAKDGGAEGIRTPDPHNAIVVLYQLSYDPIEVAGNVVGYRPLSKYFAETVIIPAPTKRDPPAKSWNDAKVDPKQFRHSHLQPRTRKESFAGHLPQSPFPCRIQALSVSFSP